MTRCAARLLPRFVLSLSLALSASTVPAAPLDADALVAAADAIRFPTEAFQIQVKVTTSGRGTPDVHEYQVLQKGHERSVVRTLAPAAEKGQVMLLRGSDLWVFMPQVSQPVRLPLSQRLTGQVANGDLARANFAGDYKATLLAEEDVDGKKCAKLELTAARKGGDLSARAVLDRTGDEAARQGRVLHRVEAPDEIRGLREFQGHGRRPAPRSPGAHR